MKPSSERASRGKPPRVDVPSLSELRTAVEAIGAPALIVSTRGEVLHANPNGRALFEANPSGIAQLFARSVARGSNEGGWKMIPLSGHNGSRRFLAILNSAPKLPAMPSPPAGATQVARVRWKLTTRQGEVLDLLARGLTNGCIAETLTIGVGTVEFHVAKIFDKAGVDNRATLIARLHDL